jgi:hypothetical protein
VTPGVLIVNLKSAVVRSSMEAPAAGISIPLLTSSSLAVAASMTFEGIAGLLISLGINLLAVSEGYFLYFSNLPLEGHDRCLLERPPAS